MLISLYLVQSKHIKMHQKEIPSISYNTSEFYSLPQNLGCFIRSSCRPRSPVRQSALKPTTNQPIDLHEKFQVAFAYVTNVNYHFWSSCYNVFLSMLINNSLSLSLCLLHTHITKNMTSKCANPSKSSFQKFDRKTIFSLLCMDKRK